MTPAVSELDRLGVTFTLHAYEHGGSGRDFGIEAADLLGFDPDQVFKTLVVTTDRGEAIAIVPVSCRLGLKALGRALGVKGVAMCDPAIAERVTGFVRGGVSPFGQKQRLPTAIDETAMLFDTIYVSGGKRGLDLGVAPDDLVRVLDATVADISAH